MTQTLTVIYDGHVFRPEIPLDLKANTRYHVTLTPVASDDSQDGTAWDVLDGLTGSVDASPDWASEHDHYLYNTPKQQPEAGA